MTPEQIAEFEAATAVARQNAEDAMGADEGLNQALVDAQKAEADAKAPSHKPERTEREKAEYSLKKNAERLAELGGNPAEVLGSPKLKIDESLSDDTPVTVGSLREIQRQDSKKTALELAEKIEDKDERERVTEILNRLTPSNNPQADLALARGSVNSSKNAQIAEEAQRIAEAKRSGSGSGAPARIEEVFEPTAEEASMMRAPFNLTKDEVIAARARSKKE